MALKHLFSWLLPGLVLGLGSSCSQPAEKDRSGAIHITGSIPDIRDTTLTFTYEAFELLAESKTEEILVDSLGKLDFTLISDYPLKGFLSFGKVPRTYHFTIQTLAGTDSLMQVESVDFRLFYLFLNPGDHIHFEVKARQVEESLKFSGEAANNNLFVNAEEWKFNDYKSKYLKNYYRYTFYQADDFITAAQALLDEKQEFLDHFQTIHPISPSLASLYLREWKQTAIRSLIAYPESHAGFNKEQYPELPANYYDFLSAAPLPQKIAEGGIGTFYYLSALLHKKYDILSPETRPENFYSFVEQELPERIAYEYKAYALGSDFRKELYSAFDSTCPYPDIAKAVKQRYQALEGMLEGQPAPNFRLLNPEGAAVVLADFKGKFVYFDFWATWCGPCIKEIPHLKKLEEEFRDSPVSFVSVSFDQAKDSLKWKSFIRENQLGGIQVWADPENHELFSSTFNIKSIPRFVLLDPEGNIVDANAPRPSNPKIRTLFNELLNHEGNSANTHK